MGSFFKKVGIGAAIGLAFGLMAALSFIGITKVVNTFFPGKAQVSAKFEAETDGTKESDKKAEKEADKDADKDEDKEKVENSQKPLMIIRSQEEAEKWE